MSLVDEAVKNSKDYSSFEFYVGKLAVRLGITLESARTLIKLKMVKEKRTKKMMNATTARRIQQGMESVIACDVRLTLEGFYLQWLNDYLTVDKFAEHNGLELGLAQAMIDEGRACHELRTREIEERAK